MTDYRFPAPGTDARFPGGGVDVYHPSPGVSGRFPSPGTDLRFMAPGLGGGAASTLNALTLSDWTIPENTAPGVTVGALLGTTAGSTLSLTNDAGGRFALSGSTLLTGLVSTDFETAASHNITVRESLAGATNTPRDTNFTINVTDVSESFDYIITSNADWGTIPAGLLSGGGLIGVSPGNYTAKTLSMTPSAPLTFRATNPANMPVIDEVTISGGNIVFEYLTLVSSRWDGVIGSCVWVSGTAGNLTVRDCLLSGNYRGNTSLTINPNLDTYPEYACIVPIFNGSGVITGFDITRPTVGDLLADGTYSMIFAASITGASATFTVSGGQIVSTNLVSGGTSAFNASTGIGIRSALISWTGQRRMINWLPFAFRSVTTGTFDNLTIERCRIQQVNSAIKCGVRSGLTVVDNDLDVIYQDYLSVGNQAGYPVYVAFNRFTRPFQTSGDPGDPHGDFGQFFMNDLNVPFTSVDWPRISFVGNFFSSAGARGTTQGWLFGENPSGIFYENPVMWGNFCGSGAALGVQFDGVEDALIGYNTIINGKHPTALGTTVSIQVPTAANGVNAAVGHSLVIDNILESFGSNSAPAGSVTAAGNIITGENGASISYASIFASPTGSQATLANAQTNYAAIGAAAGKGAFAAPGVNFAAKTIDWTQVPAWWRHEAITGQALATVVTSNWSTVIWGGTGSRSISISGGEYRIADDRSGTNATAWTSTSGTITEGKTVQVRHTTSASGSSTVTTTLTIGAQARTFQSTTAAAASFVTIDNQATAYSRVAAPVTSDTGVRRLVLALRMRPDTLTALANLAADGAATTFRFWLVSTSAFRFQINGSLIQLRPVLAPGSAFKTHIITLDLTQSTAAGANWATLEDGMVLTGSAGTGGSFNTSGGTMALNMNTQVFPNGLGIFAEADGQGTLFDGAFEFFWMDWGDNTYTIPDITQASVRNAWQADNIGANGQGPTGSTPKLYYTAASLAEANSGGGIPNKGSIASIPLVKMAGAYV